MSLRVYKKAIKATVREVQRGTLFFRHINLKVNQVSCSLCEGFKNVYRESVLDIKALCMPPASNCLLYEILCSFILRTYVLHTLASGTEQVTRRSHRHVLR